MSNQITAIQAINKELDLTNDRLQATLRNILEISKQSRDVSSNFSNVKLPQDVSERIKSTATNTQQLNAQLKEQDRLERGLISQIAKKELATEGTNRALIRNRVETQQQNRLIKDAAVLSSRLSTELQKATVRRNRLAKTIQDLNIRRSLGNKLTLQEQALLKRSTTQFNRYDKAIRGARQGVGRFQDSVGNYQKGLTGAIGLTKQLVGAFGLVQGLRLGFDFIVDSARLAREAKGVEIAFRSLGAEGRKAFEDIRAATRGTLSNLEIQRSINEFKNLGIELETSGIAFEFLSVRAAQTGRSVESLRSDLVTGLGRGSVRILDNLGLSAKELNRLVSDTGLTIQQAFGVIAQREIGLAGNILDEAVNSQEKFNAAFENFQVSAGSGFIGKLTNDIYDLGTSLVETLGDVNDASTGFGDFFVNLINTGNPAVLAQIKAQALVNRDLAKRPAIIKEIIALEESQGVILLQRRKNEDEYIRLSSKRLKAILKATQAEVDAGKVTEERVDTVADLRQAITNLRSEQEGLTENDKVRAAQIREEIKLINLRIKAIVSESKAIVDGSVKALAAHIAELTKQRDSFATTNKEIQRYNELIDKATNQLNRLKAGVQSLTATVGESSEDALIEFASFFQFEGLDAILDENSKKFEDDLKRQAENFEEHQKRVSDIQKRGLELRSKLESQFSESAIELVNSVFEARVQGYENDIEENTAYYDSILDNENLTEEQRSSIEAERDRKENELRAKQREEEKKAFVFKQALALANVGIALAQTLAEIQLAAAAIDAITFGIGGSIYRAANIPLAIGTAAIQAGAIVAATIPAFAEGKGQYDNYEGKAIWGEKRREVKISKNGNIEVSPKKIANHLTHVKSDDVIHPDANKYFAGLSDNDLMNDLDKHSIIASMEHQNSVADSFIAANMINNSSQQQTNRIVNAIKQNKTKFNVTNKVSLGQDIKYLNRKNNVL